MSWGGEVSQSHHRIVAGARLRYGTRAMTRSHQTAALSEAAPATRPAQNRTFVFEQDCT